MIVRPNDLRFRMAAAQQGVWLNTSSGPDPVGSGLRISSSDTPGVDGNTHTLTSYVVPSVTNGLLLVAAYVEDFLNVPTLTGVTFGGSAMTAVAAPVESNPQSDFRIARGLYFVLNPSGTGDIVATGTTTSGDLNRMGIVARTYANVTQSAPTLISNTAAPDPVGAGATSISSTLNSVPANALVVDSFWSRTAAPTASEARQNVYENTAIDGGLRYFGGSDDLNTSAGNVTFGWEEAAGNWFVHMMVALEKA